MNGHALNAPSSFEEQLRNLIQRDSSTSGNHVDGPAVAAPVSSQHGQDRPQVRLPHQSERSFQGYAYAVTQTPRQPPTAGHYHSTSSYSAQQPNTRPLNQSLGPSNGQGQAIHQGQHVHRASQHPQSHRGSPSRGGAVNQQRRQQIQLDPNAYQRAGGMLQQHQTHPGYQTRSTPRGLYNPNAMSQRTYLSHHDIRAKQAQYLEAIAQIKVKSVEMSDQERTEKESFRRALEVACQQVCAANAARTVVDVSLECFGSFQSGFATAGSDMDLVVVVNDQACSAQFSLLENDIPRALEQRLLELGHGARLLTRTRVPIIKVCERPPDELLSNLREERSKWDELPDEKKYPHLYPTPEVTEAENVMLPVTGSPQDRAGVASSSQVETNARDVKTLANDTAAGRPTNNAPAVTSPTISQDTLAHDTHGATAIDGPDGSKRNISQPGRKTWVRERKAGPLDFPKCGVGVQTDINFSNPLGLHNTKMLKCYSLCDIRVRPMIIFVKAWAKQRKINSSYSGTLSSYGYVLMVLHYLVNIAQPPVLPNLQSSWRPHPDCTATGAARVDVDGWTVDFWRDESQIASAVADGKMSENRESIGSLLAGFFTYYSSIGNGPQFRWMQSVLSLRTISGGILTKESKGWVKASTEQDGERRIQYRYLFCIEDPFELDHNVARTVTHNGIVTIRDEFRRAYRILINTAYSRASTDGELLDAVTEEDELSQKMAHATVKPAVTPLMAHPERPAPEAQTHHAQDSQRSHQEGSLQAPSSGNRVLLPHLRATEQKVANTATHQPRSPDIADKSAFPALGPGRPVPEANPRKPQRQRKPKPSTAEAQGQHQQGT